MSSSLLQQFNEFLTTAHLNVGKIFNEHGLQIELGIFLRSRGYAVEFERPFQFAGSTESTKKTKRELDILVTRDGVKSAIELKTPLAGRTPESMYDFIADIDFVERLIEEKIVDEGFCLLVTNNRQFWAGRSEKIYKFFRDPNSMLTGSIDKPTGSKDSSIVLKGSYALYGCWGNLTGVFMDKARYLLVPIALTR